MSFFSISLPLAFLTFWTGSAQAAKVEARKGAVRNVQICRKDRGEASLARASAQAARPSPEGVIGSMSRSVGKWIVIIPVILSQRQIGVTFAFDLARRTAEEDGVLPIDRFTTVASQRKSKDRRLRVTRNRHPVIDRVK